MESDGKSTILNKRYVICDFAHSSCVPGFGHYETSTCVDPHTADDVLGWMTRNPMYEPNRGEADLLVKRIERLKETLSDIVEHSQDPNAQKEAGRALDGS